MFSSKKVGGQFLGEEYDPARFARLCFPLSAASTSVSKEPARRGPQPDAGVSPEMGSALVGVSWSGRDTVAGKVKRRSR